MSDGIRIHFDKELSGQVLVIKCDDSLGGGEGGHRLVINRTSNLKSD